MKFFKDSSLHVDEDLMNKSSYNVVSSGKEIVTAIDYIFTCTDRIDSLQIFYPLVDDIIIKRLLHVKQRGLDIEVYINEKTKSKKELFLPFATIYYIKENEK